jgi:hypothetical protein
MATAESKNEFTLYEPTKEETESYRGRSRFLFIGSSNRDCYEIVLPPIYQPYQQRNDNNDNDSNTSTTTIKSSIIPSTWNLALMIRHRATFPLYLTQICEPTRSAAESPDELPSVTTFWQQTLSHYVIHQLHIFYSSFPTPLSLSRYNSAWGILVESGSCPRNPHLSWYRIQWLFFARG